MQAMKKDENQGEGSKKKRTEGKKTVRSTLPMALSDNRPLSRVNTSCRIPVQPMRMPESYVPSAHDVVCGRGRQSHNHIGNCSFRDKIADNLNRYMTAHTKLDKTFVVASILDELRNQSPSVKFVKKDVKTDQWLEIGDTLAREKVGHALRDAVTSHKRLIGKAQSKDSTSALVISSSVSPRTSAEQRSSASKAKRKLNHDIHLEFAKKGDDIISDKKKSPGRRKIVGREASIKNRTQQVKEDISDEHFEDFVISTLLKDEHHEAEAPEPVMGQQYPQQTEDQHSQRRPRQSLFNQHNLQRQHHVHNDSMQWFIEHPAAYRPAQLRSRNHSHHELENSSNHFVPGELYANEFNSNFQSIASRLLVGEENVDETRKILDSIGSMAETWLMNHHTPLPPSTSQRRRHKSI